MIDPHINVAITAADSLGESPFYHAATATLTRVDFVTGRIIHWAGEDHVVETGRPTVGFAVPTRSGDLVFGSGHEIVLMEGGQETILARVPGTATINDGAADPLGRLWFTSYSRDGEPVADLLRLDREGTLAAAGLGLRGPNGLAWSPDGSQLYVVESQARQLLVFDYDVHSGELGTMRVAHTFDEDDGTPDGLAVDASGDVWVALLEAGQLRSYSPDGTPKRGVQLPVSRPTNLTFVGGGDAWVTTARVRLDATALRAQPWAGSVLRVFLGVDGAPTHVVNL